MKYYIVSNAQTLGGADPHITELGQKQAARLGAYIKHIGYRGAVFADKSTRAMETAEIIANIAGLSIVDWKTDMDTANLQADTLFVGSAERADALIQTFHFRKYKPATPDCSLTVFDTDGLLEPRCKDTAHLPNAMISVGEIMHIEKKRASVQAYMAHGVELPEELKTSNSFKLLHIGDTHSEAYPFYEDLIKKVRPNVIVHTGDFVDEVKAGRMINTEEEYEAGLAKIAQILKDSGAEIIYINPGNNDIPELMRKHLGFARYVEPNSQIEIHGITCTVGHECYLTTKESQWSFYGHGLTGETWTRDMNKNLNDTCRFNASWGATVILLPDMKSFTFKEP